MSAVFLQTLLLLLLATPVYSGYCYRTKCVTRRVRVCVWKTWQGCCRYAYVSKTVVTTESYCCRGYRGRGCNTPICNPPCANGGTCGPYPGQCRCRVGFEGPACNGIAECSFRKPCYPGVCDRSCSCQSGFTNNTCLALQRDQAPRVWQATVRFVSLKTSTDPKLNGMQLYDLTGDSSNPDSNEDDVIWTNQKGFNRLEVFGAAQFDPDNLPPTPNYVDSADFGVTGAVAMVQQTKLKVDGPGRRYEAPMNYTCRDKDGRQLAGYWNCSATENFNQLISNGDELDITLTFTSGGKRLLRDPANIGGRKTESYTPVVSQRRVIFKFDLEKPRHCSEKGEADCPPPLSISQDITQSEVEISWGGWIDGLSNMYRYAWEVFRLEPVTAGGGLGEKYPLEPLINQGVLATKTPQVFFKPPVPGVYSVVLEASDLANNSRYARRLFIYDNQSDVTVNDVSPLFISSAEAGSNYAWQTNLNDDIVVDWTGHFRNELHEREKMLNRVQQYPVQFTDTEETVGESGQFTLKRVDYDDKEGKRTTSAIPNRHGIVKFEVAYAKDTPDDSLASPPSFTSVGGLSENFVISRQTRSSGERLRVWIRATDIIGHQKVEQTVVNFDDSPPTFSVDTFQQNVQGGHYPFSSRVNLNASDTESGLHSVTYRLTRGSNGAEQEAGQLDLVNYTITAAQCARRADCQCTPFSGCFITRLSLVINHCWLVVDKARLNSEVINLEVNVTNSAMLVSRDTHKIRDIPSYSGIGQYSAPSDVRVIRGGFNTVRISWNNTPSCYNITELWINYTGAAVKEKIHRLSKFYDLTGLHPETNYTAQLITGYNGEMSNPVTFVFRTGPAPAALTSSQKAGLGVGLALGLFLLLIIAGVVLLWHFGIIAVALGRKKEGKMTKAAVAFSRMSRRVRRAAVDDDIYVYGGDNFDIPLGVQIAASRLTLEELIAEGKFARVYRASLSSSATSDKETVVAKMAKESGDPIDRQLMKGKILFYINEVGEHRNVLRMIGAMMENEDYGPVMILEHCEMGPLRSWLVKQKDHVNDDVIERLFQFSLGLVSGMAYLASTGIVHRRLAARNILLTFLLEVRISGFGPTQITEEGEESNPEGNQQQERIPIRWVAPECFKSTRDATEKSDVWSYGVVLWEIFSLGDNPYPSLKSHEIPSRVKGGYRMSRPEYADDFNYQLMRDCWEREARRRPKFKELEKTYRTFMTGGSAVGYSENPYST